MDLGDFGPQRRHDRCALGSGPPFADSMKKSAGFVLHCSRTQDTRIRFAPCSLLTRTSTTRRLQSVVLPVPGNKT